MEKANNRIEIKIPIMNTPSHRPNGERRCAAMMVHHEQRRDQQLEQQAKSNATRAMSPGEVARHAAKLLGRAIRITSAASAQTICSNHTDTGLRTTTTGGAASETGAVGGV